MSDFFSDIKAQIAATYEAVPAPVVASLILAVAVALALAAHRLAMKVGERLTAWHPIARATMTQTQGPLRLAFIVLALRFATGIAPLSRETAATFSIVLQIAFVALLGWIAIVFVNITADIYLQRFRLDVSDNLLARKHVTQVRVLKGAANTLIILITCAAALMNVDTVRQVGLSLFASAGIAGIVVGLAARPLLSSLIAGVQIAVTQPIRLDDAVLVENEWGRIEEITATYVVVKLWDWRRLILPLSYFMEKPFQNWTRQSASLIGSAFFYVDYSVPVERIRAKLTEIVRASSLWDGNVISLQMTDARPHDVELRALMSARSSSDAFDLRCEVREKLIAFLKAEYPEALPHARAEVMFAAAAPEVAAPALQRHARS